MSIHFVERELFVGDGRYELPYPIDEAKEIDSLVLVLFDPDSADEGNGIFHNLVAVNRLGHIEWTAELPTSDPGDRYYKVVSIDPLIAYSARSYDCVIDRTSGRILRKSFTK